MYTSFFSVRLVVITDRECSMFNLQHDPLGSASDLPSRALTAPTANTPKASS